MEVPEIDRRLTEGGIPSSEIRRGFFDLQISPRPLMIKKNPSDICEEFLRYWQRATGGLELYWIPRSRVVDDAGEMLDPDIQRARELSQSEEVWITQKGIKLILDAENLSALKREITDKRKERHLPNKGIGIALSHLVTDDDFKQIQQVIRHIKTPR